MFGDDIKGSGGHGDGLLFLISIKEGVDHGKAVATKDDSGAADQMVSQVDRVEVVDLQFDGGTKIIRAHCDEDGGSAGKVKKTRDDAPMDPSRRREMILSDGEAEDGFGLRLGCDVIISAGYAHVISAKGADSLSEGQWDLRTGHALRVKTPTTLQGTRRKRRAHER